MPLVGLLEAAFASQKPTKGVETHRCFGAKAAFSLVQNSQPVWTCFQWLWGRNFVKFTHLPLVMENTGSIPHPTTPRRKKRSPRQFPNLATGSAGAAVRGCASVSSAAAAAREIPQDGTPRGARRDPAPPARRGLGRPDPPLHQRHRTTEQRRKAERSCSSFVAISSSPVVVLESLVQFQG